MDVSPETIRTVEFRERLRGYHQDDVDLFLERMAAGIEILQQRLRDANERAAQAEQQAQGVDADDSLRRTLVLAQQTADLAIKEARDQAARLVETAQAQSQAMLAEAEELAHRLRREAQEKVEADVSRLEAARDRLGQEVQALERFLEDERQRVHLALTEAARQVAEAMPSLSPSPVPPAVREAEEPAAPAVPLPLDPVDPLEGAAQP